MALHFQDGKLLLDADAIAMHADCCCGVDCTNCCVAGISPYEETSFIDVDFGAGGLTTGPRCAGTGAFNCADIAGIIQIGWVGDCNWGDWLTSTQFCVVAEIYYMAWFLLAIRTSGSDCYWELIVEVGEQGEPTPHGSALYRSTPIAFGEAECAVTDPVTLTKVVGSEDWDDWCNGTLPETITIQASP